IQTPHASYHCSTVSNLLWENPGTHRNIGSRSASHAAYPIQYPRMAPSTLATVVTSANQIAFLRCPRQSGASSTSGGIGKKLDSAKLIMNSDVVACLECANES